MRHEGAGAGPLDCLPHGDRYRYSRHRDVRLVAAGLRSSCQLEGEARATHAHVVRSAGGGSRPAIAQRDDTQGGAAIGERTQRHAVVLAGALVVSTDWYHALRAAGANAMLHRTAHPAHESRRSGTEPGLISPAGNASKHAHKAAGVGAAPIDEAVARA